MDAERTWIEPGGLLVLRVPQETDPELVQQMAQAAWTASGETVGVVVVVGEVEPEGVSAAVLAEVLAGREVGWEQVDDIVQDALDWERGEVRDQVGAWWRERRQEVPLDSEATIRAVVEGVAVAVGAAFGLGLLDEEAARAVTRTVIGGLEGKMVQLGIRDLLAAGDTDAGEGE